MLKEQIDVVASGGEPINVFREEPEGGVVNVGAPLDVDGNFFATDRESGLEDYLPDVYGEGPTGAIRELWAKMREHESRARERIAKVKDIAGLFSSLLPSALGDHPHLLRDVRAKLVVTGSEDGCWLVDGSRRVVERAGDEVAAVSCTLSVKDTDLLAFVRGQKSVLTDDVIAWAAMDAPRRAGIEVDGDARSAYELTKLLRRL
jgi:hypothetical protein